MLVQGNRILSNNLDTNPHETKPAKKRLLLVKHTKELLKAFFPFLSAAQNRF